MSAVKHGLLLGLLAAGLTFGAAHATVVEGSFSGVIATGTARGDFGYAYDDPTSLVGMSITGTFRYDTALLSPSCPLTTSFFGCFVGTGMTISETINGVTEVFDGAPETLDDGRTLPFNNGEGGLALYNLTPDASVNLHTQSGIGDYTKLYTARSASLSITLPEGSIVDADNPVLDFVGPASTGGTDYIIGDQFFGFNSTSISQQTFGNDTELTSYTFGIDTFTSGAVPEPATWALMILGVGLAGGVARRQRLTAI